MHDSSYEDIGNSTCNSGYEVNSDKWFRSIDGNWNENVNVNKIHLHAGVKITAHIHDHEKWNCCHPYNNSGTEVMKINQPEGISFIGYDKVCADFLEPKPTPASTGESYEWILDEFVSAKYSYDDY